MQPTELKHVLAPVDFSTFSARAAVAAGEWSRRLGTGLTLLHVVESQRPELSAAEVNPHVGAGDWSRIGFQHLEQFAGAVRAGGADTSKVLAVGDPVEEITTLADRLQAGLIVVGTHGHGETARQRFVEFLEADVTLMGRRQSVERRHLLLGSTAERIVRHAPCSVLVVRSREQGSGARSWQMVEPARRILLATDLSPHSLRAFPLAARLAREFDARLHLAHVVPRAEGAAGADAARMPADPGRALADFRREHLAPDVPVDEWLLAGEADQALCAAARDRNCDLIVMATHGYTGLKHALLGSTAERVVRNAPCPVLVVR